MVSLRVHKHTCGLCVCVSGVCIDLCILYMVCVIMIRYAQAVCGVCKHVYDMWGVNVCGGIGERPGWSACKHGQVSSPAGGQARAEDGMCWVPPQGVESCAVPSVTGWASRELTHTWGLACVGDGF
jgi:hypothetical protein